MKKVLMFLKKYWITMLIVVACALWYAYATNHQMLDTFVFSTPEDIGKSFSKFRGTMVKNMFASFQLLFPSLFLGVVIALAFGILMGLNKRIREIFQPIVYAISVIPAILLSPIALHVAPNFRMASVFLIVYNTVWPTLFGHIGRLVAEKAIGLGMKVIGYDPYVTQEQIDDKIAEKNNFQCIASFGTKFFPGKKSLKQGGVFSYAPLSVEFDRIDVMNAIMADIACGITLHYRELQKIKSHDKKYVIGCGGGFQSQTLGKRIASLINKEVVLPPHYEQASLNGCIKICQKTLKKSVEDHDHVRIIEPGEDILLEEYYEKWRTVRKIYEEVEF